jgi:hypothetical protein
LKRLDLPTNQSIPINQSQAKKIKKKIAFRGDDSPWFQKSQAKKQKVFGAEDRESDFIQ